MLIINSNRILKQEKVAAMKGKRTLKVPEVKKP